MPRQAQQPAARDGLSGLIERVTYHNEETGFAVLRVKVKGRRDVVTVVGSLPAVSPGEWLTAEGRWTRDREHGLQLRAEFLKCSEPNSREGIEKYLGSGLIKGIGPVFAKKLVAKFGEGIFEVIETCSARLEEIDGVGAGRRRKIKEAWEEQKAIRDIMVFLHAHGVGTSRAVRIYRTYGAEAIATVRSDPYVLARDIPGIGFKTADGIARRLGIPADSLIRARAGLEHQLLEATTAGHCALPRGELLEQSAAALDIPMDLAAEAIARLAADQRVVEESIAGETLVFLPATHAAECGIARIIRRLADAPATLPEMDTAKAIAWCEEKTATRLSDTQREAVSLALTRRALIITGGPGVGKTTLIHSLLRILRAKKARCLLCAPTGRAAKRLGEATGMEAKTIHRLLQFTPASGGFARNEEQPLDCDVLIADETSMVDVPLMHKLLRALPQHAHLVLVGDVDQLPSVGPGAVLGDLIASAILPVVRLTGIFRQAAGSRIITNAHRVNEGLPPEPGGREDDFHFVPRDSPETIRDMIVKLAAERIPARLGCDPVADVQVLCPMHKGPLGARALNELMQSTLNPPRRDHPGVIRFGWEFRVGDKVLQTRNNYDKDVFNGDIGVVAAVDFEEGELRVRYDDRSVQYAFGELDEIGPAYAITIHKAQGSEFPAVIVPLAMQHFVMLQRNLLYTAITRGKRLVALIGDEKALSLAIRNNPSRKRISALRERLTGA